ncbi:MAG: hypothetical protein AB7Q97_27080 [Gammaproteobacteria bacterium]
MNTNENPAEAIDFGNRVSITTYEPTLDSLGFDSAPHRLRLSGGACVLCVMVKTERGTVFNWNRVVQAAATAVEAKSYAPQAGISRIGQGWHAGPCRTAKTTSHICVEAPGLALELNRDELHLREGEGEAELRGTGLGRSIHVLMPQVGEDILYRASFWELDGTVGGERVRGFARWVQLHGEEGQSWFTSRFWGGGIETAWWIGFNAYDGGAREVCYLVAGAGEWGWTVAVTQHGVAEMSARCDDIVDLDEQGFPRRLTFAHPANAAIWVCEAYPGAGFLLDKHPEIGVRWAVGEARRVGEPRQVEFSLGLLETFPDHAQRRARRRPDIVPHP